MMKEKLFMAYNFSVVEKKESLSKLKFHRESIKIKK